MDRLCGYVRDLSDAGMMGRLAGTAGADKAAAYLEKELRRLKLEVHTQEVTFPLYEISNPTAFELLAADGRVTKAYRYVDDYREVDFTGSADVRGELVFVGYGLDAAYEGVDVQGKIVLLLTGVPAGGDAEEARIDRKIDRACKRGAKAAVFVPCGPLGLQIAQSSVEAKLRALDGKRELHPELLHADMPAVFVHQPLVAELSGKSTDELMKDPTSRSTGNQVRLQLNGKVRLNAKSRNIIAVLRGSDPVLAREVLLLGAHYDHLGRGGDGRIFYGASDNAAGTAVVLEAAQAFAAAGVKPRRTLVFAFWCAEELGLYGSKHYVNQQPLLPLEDTKLMIQLDYLGNQEGPCLSNVNDNPLIQGFLGDAVNEKRVIVLDTRGQCASDDCPFLDKKIPAYRFIAFGDHHHRSSDTFANLNREMVKKTADLVISGIGRIAF